MTLVLTKYYLLKKNLMVKKIHLNITLDIMMKMLLDQYV